MHVAWLWLGSNRIKEAWRLAPWTAPGRRRKLRNGGTAPVALGRTSRCRGGGAASLSLDEPLVTLVYARRHRENRQTDRHLTRRQTRTSTYVRTESGTIKTGQCVLILSYLVSDCKVHVDAKTRTFTFLWNLVVHRLHRQSGASNSACNCVLRQRYAGFGCF